MRALLRADWLRLRRRIDLWIIVIGVLVIAGASFLNGYAGDVQDPPPFDRAAYTKELVDSGMFVGLTQAEQDEQLRQLIADAQAGAEAGNAQHETDQAVALQRYGMPQAPLTVLSSSLFALIALALIASLAVGDEFRFGTLRTSLLAAADRRRFLAARMISLLLVTLGMFLALMLVAIVLSAGLAVVGAELPVAAPIDLPAAIGLVLADILAASVVILLTALLSLLMRSGALAFLVALLVLLLDLFLSQLSAFRALGSDTPLAAVPQLSLANSMRTLQAVLGHAAGGLAFADVPVSNGPLDLGPGALALIVAGWGVVFLFVADRRIRRMDVVE